MAKDFTVERNSPKYLLNKDGILEEFVNDYPSFEFNEDGTYRGLLSEEKAINLLLYNEDFSQSSWDDINSITEQSTVETPDQDNTNRYIKIVTDDINDAGSLTGNRLGITQKIPTIEEGNIYTLSVFVKIDQVDQPKYVILQAQGSDVINNNAVDSIAFFDLNGNGSVGSEFRNISAGIKKYYNDWFFCWITWEQKLEVDSNTNVRFDFYGGSGPNQPLQKGTSYSGYFWRPQLEKNSTFSSPIKTEGTVVTRNADVITMSDASQYIPSSGTVIIEWEQKTTGKVYIGALSADFAEGKRKLRFQYSPTQQSLFIGDSTTAVDSITGTFDFSGMAKIELGHANEANQPNTNIRYFAII